MLNLNAVSTILTILGSLSLFLFGMKLMSESLQRFSGNRLKAVFTQIASNKLKAITAGFIVTGIIQSSSAVTVMLVSFVNAGLFSLSQALGIMMGANIGTTVTAWLIALFGFRFEFSSILLPVLGLSLPFLFLPGLRNRSIGEFIFGFAILFLGIQFLKNSFPDIDENSPILTFFASISGPGTYKYLIYAGAGLIVTMIIQSSSATIALTVVMCSKGYITYDAAAAMVLGENLGTTITANIAALIANRSAKRLALGHTLFNFFGLLWAFVFFKSLVNFSSDAALLISGNTNIPENTLYPIGISILHSSFNLINTLILAWFIPSFKTLLERIIPLQVSEKKNYRLRYFKSRFMAMSDVDILQAHEEIHNAGKHVALMFSIIPEYLLEKAEGKYLALRNDIYRYKTQSEQLKLEITGFMTRIAENDLSEANSRRLTSMFKITDEIQNIAEVCIQMEQTIRNKNEIKAWFSPEMREELFSLFNHVNYALETMNENLMNEHQPGLITKVSDNQFKFNELRNKLAQLNKQRLESRECNYSQAEIYNVLLTQCEKLTNHVININQAIASNTK